MEKGTRAETLLRTEQSVGVQRERNRILHQGAPSEKKMNP